MMGSPSVRQAAIRFGLDALYFSGAHRLFGARCGGAGIILTLHHVCPARSDSFQPNRSLEITPEFLDSALEVLRRQEVEFVALDEVPRRMRAAAGSRRFACVTFDDGYRDVLQWAVPILKQRGIPFAIFVTSDFAQGRGHLWWRTIERAISLNDRLTIRIEGLAYSFACRTTAEKYAAFRALAAELSKLRSDASLRGAMQELADQTGFDVHAHCAESCLGWTELAGLASDPLVTIGAHSVTHPRLRTLPTAAARWEMEASAACIEAALGSRPSHFAYPFGDASAAGPREFALAAELGFRSAVTTRPGVLPADADSRLMCLPRISLNGNYQRLRYLQVLVSGVPSATWSGLQQLRAIRSVG